jgi:hypothetical protein
VQLQCLRVRALMAVYDAYQPIIRLHSQVMHTRFKTEFIDKGALYSSSATLSLASFS